MRIAVLCGGGSAEREVSLRSGAAMTRALARRGYDAAQLILDSTYLQLESAATELPAGNNSAPALPSEASSALDSLRGVDLVLTSLHGAAGENGAWQGLLELAGLPYVSAGVKGSALAMDKVVTKRLLASLGIDTPRWWLYRSGDAWPVPSDITEIVAKPVSEGSSVGVVLTTNDAAGRAAVAELATRYSPVLIEQRIHGPELTCGVIGLSADPLPLPLVEIRAGGQFYDYTAKYTSGGSEYICPAEIDPGVARRIQSDATLAYRELELEPFARLDCLLDADGRHWFLEANTLPGFTELSLLPMAARAAGVEMDELLELLMLFALERREARRAVEVA